MARARAPHGRAVGRQRGPRSKAERATRLARTRGVGAGVEPQAGDHRVGMAAVGVDGDPLALPPR